MKNRVVRVFLDANMSCAHKGLGLMAARHKVKLDEMGANEHAVFINSNLNKIKIWSAGGLISYARKDNGKIDMRYISEIPKAFDEDGNFDFDKAVKASLMKILPIGVTELSK